MLPVEPNTHTHMCRRGASEKRTETSHENIRSSWIESYKCARALWKWQSRRYWSMTVCLERTHQIYIKTRGRGEQERETINEQQKSTQNIFFGQNQNLYFLIRTPPSIGWLCSKDGLFHSCCGSYCAAVVAFVSFLMYTTNATNAGCWPAGAHLILHFFGFCFIHFFIFLWVPFWRFAFQMNYSPGITIAIAIESEDFSLAWQTEWNKTESDATQEKKKNENMEFMKRLA